MPYGPGSINYASSNELIDKAQQPSPVIQELERLTSVVSLLTDQAVRIQNRLKPLLVSAPPPAPGSKAAQLSVIGSSDIVIMLAARTEELHLTLQLLRETCDRLEV